MVTQSIMYWANERRWQAVKTAQAEGVEKSNPSLSCEFQETIPGSDEVYMAK